MRTIVIANHEDKPVSEATPTRTGEYREVSAKAARIDCVKAALHAISEANVNTDPEARALAIAEYRHHRQRALDYCIQASELRKRCENLHYRCLVALLRAIAFTVVDSNPDLRETLVDWYEDDRQRMIDAGYSKKFIDGRASARVWKGIR
jgi:hypothetical protein